MSNHGPMMGCFDPLCPACKADAMPSYVRYHEIGNRPEKPRLSLNIKDSSFDYINRVVMSSMAKAFAVTPAELGVIEKSNYSKETDMSLTYHNVSIDLGNISSNSSSLSSERSFLSEVEAKAKDNPELAKKLKETAEKAEREHKADIEKALKGVNYLAMKEGHSGRDFCVSFWRNGEAHSLDGTDYAYGEYIKEDDIDDEARVFVSGSVWPACGVHATMDRLKQRLERSEILYVIEYYPDQD